MADALGISYVQVLKSALIPALLYFLSVGAGVHWRAWRLGLSGMSKRRICARSFGSVGICFCLSWQSCSCSSPATIP